MRQNEIICQNFCLHATAAPLFCVLTNKTRENSNFIKILADNFIRSLLLASDATFEKRLDLE